MLIENINTASPTWDLIGFFDDTHNEDNTINGYRFLGNMDRLNKFSEQLHVAVAIGSPKIKRVVLKGISNPNVLFPILIHPTAIVGNSKYISIGEGSIITAGCIVTVNVEMGKHVILNLCCTVGHDTVIRDYCSFMPGVNISGEVNIGECVYVGTGAKIINQVHVGQNTIIGAGAVVSKSLPADCTAVGVPAKPIKFHTQAELNGSANS